MMKSNSWPCTGHPNNPTTIFRMLSKHVLSSVRLGAVTFPVQCPAIFWGETLSLPSFPASILSWCSSWELWSLLCSGTGLRGSRVCRVDCLSYLIQGSLNRKGFSHSTDFCLQLWSLVVCHWAAQNQNLKVPDLADISEHSHADQWLLLQLVCFVSDVSLEGRHTQ